MLNNYTLLKYLDNLLTPEKFKDYCPNGLQVEGCSDISRIITGVSLSEQLIDVAIADKAQAIVVHHGVFWNKDDYSLVGIKKSRIEKLIKNDINLYAYHLPLDNHPKLGNNVQLANLLGINVLGTSGEQNLLWNGKLEQPITLSKFIHQIDYKLHHKSLCLSSDPLKLIKTVAWCTGGADGFFNEAIKLGVNVYISGEASEPTMSMALESKVAYIAAGHYATERGGVQALAKHLKEQFGVSAQFIELYNPV